MGEHARYVDVHGVGPSTPIARKGASLFSHHTTAIHKSARPTIRIIHIVAPEIIKTDAANFRDLVQRLTGRQRQLQQEPAADSTATTGVALAPKPLRPVEEERVVQEEAVPAAVRKRPAAAPAALLAADHVVQQENRRRKKIKCEVVKLEDGRFGFGGGDLDHGELWMDLNPGGFLSFLEDDVFRGMADPDFLQPLGSSRMDFVGEMCASYLA